MVQNEKRQGENRPYGRVFESVLRASFPEGHPYRWTVIGSMEDLNAATLDDVQEWFRTYYGAANAVLVLAGDIDVATAREKAQQYFGHIPAGPALTRPGTWIAPRAESTRDVMYDQVAQSRVYRFWNAPPRGTDQAELLAIAGYILGGSKTSRLYERLVYRERLADTVNAGLSAFEIAGLFSVSADVKKGVEHARVEAAIAEELRRFIDKGPTAEELQRARTTLRAGFVKGLERIGGFGGKADVLAACEVYQGDPGCYRRSLERLDAATAEQVRDAARRWLSQGDHALEVHPFPAYRNAAASAVDRSTGLPATATFPAVAFPQLERRTLANGLPVVIANAARRAGGASVGAVRRRLRRRPGPQARHRQLHHGLARRGHAQPRCTRDRRARRVPRCGPEQRFVARHLVRRSVGTGGAARRIRRAARRRGAQPGLRARGDRARAQGVDRRHRP